MDEIFKRRSVRKFTDAPVEDEAVTQLLKAAMRAPSAGDEQPWEFIVLRDRETMIQVIDFHAYASMLRHAPCAIVVCGDVEKQRFEDDYWVQDCAAATENLLLEAVHLGLGAVWMALYPVKERVAGAKALFGITAVAIGVTLVLGLVIRRQYMRLLGKS